MLQAQDVRDRRGTGQLFVTAWLMSLLILLLPPLLHAGFEGFGSGTLGGNNGDVVEVTSLADAGSGSLREALSGSNRRIVFAVGGTISLQSRLEIRGKSSITIDGSTAPAPGITLDGNILYIRTSDNIIVHHIRVRNSVDDNILVWDGSENVVIDHCSVSDGGDENISITEDTHDVTVSWCLLGDTRANSFDLHTSGSLIANSNQPAVTNVSLHHNLFNHFFQRSPQISTAGLFDLRHNVIWDWGSYGIRIRNGAFGNIINNVFETFNNPENAVVLTGSAGPVYIQGNLGPGTTDVNSLSTASDPFVVALVTTEDEDDPEAVAAVADTVWGSAGAFPRDAIDVSLAGPSPPPTNNSPIADVGPDQTATVDEGLSFDGSGSTDPNGDPLTYTWYFGDGTLASGVAPTHAYGTEGVYTVTLIVSDGALNAYDTAQVTVMAAPNHDVAVTSINAPASVTKGESVTISVSVSNEGTFDENFEVSLTDTPPAGGTAGTVDSPLTVMLSAGTSSDLTFTWDTTNASAGDHALTATASPVPGETDTADNSQTATVTVNESGSPTISVQSVIVTLAKKGPKWEGKATVTVVDGTDALVDGATVTGNWDLNGTPFNSEASGTTNNNGEAKINSGRVAANSGDKFTFTVTTVSKAGSTWDGIPQYGFTFVP